jgi:hypothetical protein
MGKTIRFNTDSAYQDACKKYPSCQRPLLKRFHHHNTLTPALLRRMKGMVASGRMSDATASAIIYAVHKSSRTGR